MGRPTYAITPGIPRTSDRNGPKVTDPQACHVNSSCVSAKNSKHFVIPGHIKQSRPGYKVQPVLLKAYPIDRHLCVVTHLNEYIERTKSLRSVESRLFISYVKPHKGVSKDTISRWISTVMTDAGIDVNVFKPHSTRSAATSKALQSCVPIQDVLKQAGWSNQRTFDRFYNKPVNYSSGFAEAVLGVQ